MGWWWRWRGGRKVPSFPSRASLITLQPAWLCQPPLRRDFRNSVFPTQGHVSPPITSPVPGWPSALLMHRHPSPFRHMCLDFEEGERTPQQRSLSCRACQERVVMPCSLILNLTLHVREAHFSPHPPALHPCEVRGHCKDKRSASQSEGSTRPSRQPHRHTPTASMTFSRSKRGHTTRRRWRRHTHTHRIARPLRYATYGTPCLLPPVSPRWDGD